MASFQAFLATFDPDVRKRGEQFERFVRWFLPQDAYWKAKIKTVWLWEDYPDKWGRDCGIDLIFETNDAKIWAVQAKCYKPEHEITKADVDKFLSESNRSQIVGRLLIATTDRIGKNALQVCAGQEKQVVRHHLRHFEDAGDVYPENARRLLAPQPKVLRRPRPHQLSAINDACSGFESASRGQLVMACGTGKTLVGLWIAEKLAARKTLVLVPSLSLLSQTLTEWTRTSSSDFDVLCVCSDQTVGKQDDAVAHVDDAPFPVHNSPEEIVKFLAAKQQQVVFATYQSSPLIVEAQRRCAVEFDLIIADEAHRCAGKIDTAFANVLDQFALKGRRRLFATATPRIYKGGLKKAAGEYGVEIVDMADEKIFGPRFHTLTFGNAIRQDLLTDYRVVIVAVDHAQTKEWIDTRKIVETNPSEAIDSQSLATQIGLLKAIKDWDLRRVITFHSRVRGAKDFSEQILNTNRWLNAGYGQSITFIADYISGEMSAIERRRKLDRFKESSVPAINILSNAKCLSEGVDVPALDCVAFIDPRGSEIDIVQSVGRAIRLSPNKKNGTIVIPVFIGSEDPIEAMETSEFSAVWRVVDALKSHDDVLSNELDQLRIDLGARPVRDRGFAGLTKIVIDLPASVDVSFAQSLRAQIVERTTESWMYWYGLLLAFQVEHGHVAVPKEFITKEGHRLGYWAQGQRSKKRKLSAERIRLLDQVGFDWDPFGRLWNDGFEHLRTFQNQHGHLDVPWKYVSSDGYPLRNWVQRQREQKSELPLSRIERLNAIGFQWSAGKDRWDEQCKRLESLYALQGHCEIPPALSEYRALRSWCFEQRKSERELTRDQIARLTAIGFRWAEANDWEAGFQAFLAYRKENGSRAILPKFRTEDGFRLGRWVVKVRENQKALTNEQVALLDEYQFDWGWRAGRPAIGWDHAFENLRNFQIENSHCRVPIAYKSIDGFALGRWVKQQRQEKQRIPQERISKLESIGFEWTPRLDEWDRGFAALAEFQKEHGHCRVPVKYKTAGGFSLGKWVAGQRVYQVKVAPDRKAALDKLGFDWDPYQSKWDDGIGHLRAYVSKHGDARVPFHYKSPDGYPLGFWVQSHRKRKDKLSTERLEQLSGLGFVWSGRDD